MDAVPAARRSTRVDHQGTRFFKRFTFGRLADLSVLETRQNRSAQVDVAPYTKTGGGFIPSGAPGRRRRSSPTPTGTCPSRSSCAGSRRAVAKQGRSWHLVGNQVIFTPIRFPGAALGLPAGDYLNSDQWDGYQADQAALIEHLDAHDSRHGDAVFLTGDIHSSWAMDVPVERAAGLPLGGGRVRLPVGDQRRLLRARPRLGTGRAGAGGRAADPRPDHGGGRRRTRGSATSTASGTASSSST